VATKNYLSANIVQGEHFACAALLVPVQCATGNKWWLV